MSLNPGSARIQQDWAGGTLTAEETRHRERPDSADAGSTTFGADHRPGVSWYISRVVAVQGSPLPAAAKASTMEPADVILEGAPRKRPLLVRTNKPKRTGQSSGC